MRFGARCGASGGALFCASLRQHACRGGRRSCLAGLPWPRRTACARYTTSGWPQLPCKSWTANAGVAQCMSQSALSFL